MFLQVALEGKMAIDKMTTAHTDPRQIRECTIEGEVTDGLSDMTARVVAKYGAQLAHNGLQVGKVVHAVNLKDWMTEALNGFLRVRYTVTKL